ncbi:hypothetical protein A6R68_11171, partial [Neotoma lepida]
CSSEELDGERGEPGTLSVKRQVRRDKGRVTSPFMSRGPVSNVPGASHQITKVKVKFRPLGSSDGLMCGAVEDLSIASADHCPGHLLKLDSLALGHGGRSTAPNTSGQKYLPHEPGLRKV